MMQSVSVIADAIICKTLLSVCKLHKNAEIGRRVVVKVFTIDPQDFASYVYLPIFILQLRDGKMVLR